MSVNNIADPDVHKDPASLRFAAVCQLVLAYSRDALITNTRHTTSFRDVDLKGDIFGGTIYPLSLTVSFYTCEVMPGEGRTIRYPPLGPKRQ